MKPSAPKGGRRRAMWGRVCVWKRELSVVVDGSRLDLWALCERARARATAVVMQGERWLRREPQPGGGAGAMVAWLWRESPRNTIAAWFCFVPQWRRRLDANAVDAAVHSPRPRSEIETEAGREPKARARELAFAFKY